MKYAVYGTLRLNQGNYYNILHNAKGVKYLETKRIDGYDMFSIGGFPGVIRGEGSIVVDVFQVDNPLIESRLDSLEGYDPIMGAEGSWYDKQQTDDGEWIYIWQEERHNGKISHGDWVKHKEERYV